MAIARIAKAHTIQLGSARQNSGEKDRLTDQFCSLVDDAGGASDVEGGSGLLAAGAGAAFSLGAGSSSAS